MKKIIDFSANIKSWFLTKKIRKEIGGFSVPTTPGGGAAVILVLTFASIMIVILGVWTIVQTLSKANKIVLSIIGVTAALLFLVWLPYNVSTAVFIVSNIATIVQLILIAIQKLIKMVSLLSFLVP